jgi:hypothetical protein
MAPAAANQRVRTTHLEAPRFRVALLVADRDKEPDMRIRPLDRRDRSAELHDLLAIEDGVERMVGSASAMRLPLSSSRMSSSSALPAATITSLRVNGANAQPGIATEIV